jgi:hypothetical protein
MLICEVKSLFLHFWIIPNNENCLRLIASIHKLEYIEMVSQFIGRVVPPLPHTLVATGLKIWNNRMTVFSIFYVILSKLLSQLSGINDNALSSCANLFSLIQNFV